MTTLLPSAGTPLAQVDPASAARRETRSPRKPLAPVHPGEAAGMDPDPQRDVAPNLGGEEQMQDA